MLKALGSPAYDAPWTCPKKLVSPTYGGRQMPAKSRHMMDLAILDRCQALCLDPDKVGSCQTVRALIAEDFFVDLNSSIERKPWTHVTVGAITTRTVLYSFAHDRLLKPQELLWICGRAPVVGNFTERDLCDLVGNAMCAQTMSVLLHAALRVFGRRLPQAAHTSQRNRG